MTIQRLIDRIREFKEIIIDSGLLKDVEGYIASCGKQHNKTNVTFLKEVNDKMIDSLSIVYSGDYPKKFSTLFPSAKLRPFTEENYLEIFIQLKKNTRLNVSERFAQMIGDLKQLRAIIKRNNTSLDALMAQILPFNKVIKVEIEEEHRAILSIDFKHETTIGSLRTFSNTLKNWDRTLHIYHQLLSSKSPQDIQLVEIESGSIDIVLNVDFNIAKSIIELFTAGLGAFTAYLLWKAQRTEMSKSYKGNETLHKLDEEYAKELIKNVGEAIKNELINQHLRQKKADTKLQSTSIETKYSEVVRLLKEHVVKGNEVKLISVASHEVSIKKLEIKSKKLSKKVRKELKSLKKEELVKMIGEFIPEEKKKKGSC